MVIIMSTLLQNPMIGRIAAAAVSGMQSAAARQDNDLSPAAVSDAKGTIATEVAKAIDQSPELQHLTNSEAWWKKRSRWAAIVSLVFPILVPLGAKYGLDLDSKTQEQIIEVCVAVGGIVASYLAYRAGTATKPLGA